MPRTGSRGPGDLPEPEELSAEKEWRTRHVAGLAATAVPLSLADQIREVGAQLDALIEADRPMAALAAVRLSDGRFARQARDAKLRASYLDHWPHGSATGSPDRSEPTPRNSHWTHWVQHP